MVSTKAVSQSGSKPTAHKAKLSSSSRIRGSSGMSSHHHHHSIVGRSNFKAAYHPSSSSQPPLLRDSHRYIAEEMDQQRQDHGSNDIRHHDYENGDNGREGSPDDGDDEVRDEFPLESYLGGGNSSVPVLSNQGLLPYPNTNEASASAAAANSAPGLEGDLNNLIIDSQNSWDVLNQNDSFGFDFNKSGEMSLSFESHDYNVLDSTAVTESMDGDNTTTQQNQIDWATVAPQLDMHGNLIPPTSTTSSSGGMMGFADSSSRNNHHLHDNGQSYHHLVEMGGTAGEDPFAYAFGGGANNHMPTKKSTSRKGTRKGAAGGGPGDNGKRKKGRGAKSKKNQRDHFNMGPNPVPSFYSGNNNYHGDVPQLVSSSSNASWQHDAHHGGYNMPHSSSPSDYHPPNHHKGGRRSTTQPRTSSRDGQRFSGAALLTTESGIVLTREQAPGIGWPPVEDQALQEVMARHKSPINWEVVAKEMNFGRLARECHDRWTRYLKPGTRKGQWKEEEDAIVLRVIATSSEHPFTQWADLAPMLPGRSGKQIRDRWVNYLNPAINHLPFSREDDLKLWAGHRDLGKRWVEISVKIFNSTRSENHIKNRWYSAAFKKFIANEFGNCAYVDASPSFGSNSHDATTGGANNMQGI
ncbi:hypothetical protein ACHAWT_000520 [Skeletonema menzelii]|mmetsp:Transcript_11671/g.19127  ORF Transcript_11671/g.19127 Transcript_11671/m.19127 type:complete len:637 (+) Transcript_11671:219-2129(+)|eukprot:scaffold4335_cov148-Skeletonema_menzelii.AAC.10